MSALVDAMLQLDHEVDGVERVAVALFDEGAIRTRPAQGRKGRRGSSSNIGLPECCEDSRPLTFSMTKIAWTMHLDDPQVFPVEEVLHVILEGPSLALDLPASEYAAWRPTDEHPGVLVTQGRTDLCIDAGFVGSRLQRVFSACAKASATAGIFLNICSSISLRM